MPTIAMTTPVVRGSTGGGGIWASRWHNAVRRSPVTAVDGARSAGSPRASNRASACGNNVFGPIGLGIVGCVRGGARAGGIIGAAGSAVTRR